MMSDETSSLWDILPSSYFLVEAKVSKDKCWTSRDTGSAMDVNSVSLVLLESALDFLRTLEESVLVVFISLIDWEVRYSDAVVLIGVLDLVPLHISISHLLTGHKVNDISDTLISQGFDIMLVVGSDCWHSTNGDSCIINLGDSKVSFDVTVAFIDHTVDKENSSSDSLIFSLKFTKESIVFVWVLDIKDSLWLSFSGVASSRSVNILVMIIKIKLIGSVNVLVRLILVDPYGDIIRFNILSIFIFEPVVSSLRSFHSNVTHLLEIRVVSNQVHFFPIKESWMENSKSDLNFLPDIMKLDESLVSVVQSLSLSSKVSVFGLCTVSKKFEIANSIDSTFDINSFSILDYDIFIGEMRCSGPDWLDGLPNVIFSPLKSNGTLILPISYLWDVSNDMNILSRNGLVFNTQI